MTSKLTVLCLLQGIDAAIFSSDMSTMDCLMATSADGVSNGQYCLDANSWTTGQCCDFTAAVPGDGLCAVAPQSDGKEYSSGKAFCGRKDSISNRFLREFLMPSDTKYCPIDYEISQVTASQMNKVHEFNIEVPNAAADTWHCKYGLTTSNMIPAGTPEASRGYYYLAAESYGFDNNVIIIVQPRG